MATNQPNKQTPAQESRPESKPAEKTQETQKQEVVHLFSRMHNYYISTVGQQERRLLGSNNEVVTEVNVPGEGWQFNKCRLVVPKAEFDKFKSNPKKWGYWGDVDFTDAKTLYMWIIEENPKGEVFIQHMHKSLILADVLGQKDKLYQEGPFHIAIVEELEKICGVPTRKRAAPMLAAAMAEDAK